MCVCVCDCVCDCVCVCVCVCVFSKRFFPYSLYVNEMVCVCLFESALYLEINKKNCYISSGISPQGECNMGIASQEKVTY